MEVISQILHKVSSEPGSPPVVIEKIIGYERLIVPAIRLLDICKLLKNDFDFDLLVDIVGVDRFTENDRFEVIYNLWSDVHKSRIFIKVKLDSNKPHVESVSSIWSTANWQEREVYDMFGIIFLNHPDLRRIYMMDNFEYYPLRKDFPLTGIPGSVELPKK
jgi:NADH-quinone oxidoreductase subunit C